MQYKLINVDHYPISIIYVDVVLLVDDAFERQQFPSLSVDSIGSAKSDLVEPDVGASSIR